MIYEATHSTVASFFRAYGHVVTAHPKRILIAALLFAAAILTGARLIEFLDDPQDQWTSPNARPADEEKFYRSKFESTATELVFILKLEDETEFSPSFWARMVELDDKIRKLESPTGTTLEDVCLRIYPSLECVIQTPLEYLTPEERANVTSFTEAELRQRYEENPLGTDEWPKPLIHSEDGWIMAYPVNDFGPFSSMRKDFDESLVDLADEETIFILPAYWSGEVNRSTSSSIIQLIVGMAIMTVYVVVRLGRDPLRKTWRIGSALTSFVVVVVSLGTAISLGAAFDIPFTAITPVLAFISLGIGLDDSIILIDSMDNVPLHFGTLAERVANALEHAGTSILMTSLSSILAFTFAVTSIYPALSAFCWTTAVMVFMLLLNTHVMLVPVLVLQQRADDAKLEARAAESAATGAPVAELGVEPNPRIRKFIRNSYVPLLTSKVCQVVVLLLTLGIAGGSTYLATKVKVGQEYASIVPYDSFINPVVDTQRAHFDGERLAIDLVVVYPQLHIPQVRAAIDDLFVELKESDDVIDESVRYWEPALSAYAAATNQSLDTEEDLSRTLHSFLADDRFAAFGSSFFFSSGTVVGAIRSTFIATATQSNTESIGQHRRLRNLVYDIADDAEGFDAFVFNGNTRFKEASDGILDELLVGIVGSNILILLMLLAFLYPPVAVITFLLALLAQLNTIGAVTVWHASVLPEMNLDVVALVTTTMAVGFSVDLLAHLSAAFQHPERGSSVERVTYALISVGPASFAGGFSTLLGVSNLSWAGAPSFRIFFYQMLVIIVGSLFNVFLALPIALLYVSPPNRTPAVEVHDEPEDEPVVVAAAEPKAPGPVTVMSNAKVIVENQPAKVEAPVMVEIGADEEEPAASGTEMVEMTI
jgi:predicted RND superfamily exporter protein